LVEYYNAFIEIVKDRIVANAKRLSFDKIQADCCDDQMGDKQIQKRIHSSEHCVQNQFRRQLFVIKKLPRDYIADVDD